MRARRVRFLVSGIPGFLLAVLATGISCFAADAPSAKQIFAFRPVQQDVVFDTPSQAEYDKCKVNVERRGKQSGWVVLGPNGQVLRRFVDTNGDNVVDQWRYYHNGLEVYRDLDTDFNNKVDQSRWLNTAGSRWGIDSNEDGQLDSWKTISAEEVTREAVRALANADEKILKRILISSADIQALGINEKIAQKIGDSVKSPGQKLKNILAKNTRLNSKSRWLRFNGTQPGVVPADEGKASQDLTVYENAMAIVDTDGTSSLVLIGELIQVGKTWKLTQIPRPLADNEQVAAGGLLMQPLAAVNTPVGNTPAPMSLSPEMQKLLETLQTLDRNAPKPTAGTAALTRYNTQRADLIEKLVELSKTDKERDQWTRQLVDGLAAGVQTGLSKDGLKRLKALETKTRQTRPKSDILAYISFRRLLAQYTDELQKSKPEQRAALQKWWLDELEKFAKTYPQSPDAPEAILQLAITQEFAGKIDEAKAWYRKLVADYPQTEAGERASGAMRRLELVGKKLRFSGPGLTGGTIDVASYRGKVLLVLFWSTWCKPCTQELPQLQNLYAKYQKNGFEILGVNLDVTSEPVKGYLTQYNVRWPQIHKDGGLESGPGKAFGIISLPTMFLVDRNGTVVSRSVSIDSLKKQLPTLLAK
ncbi:MAG: TlpA disulfide reductase family protein [Planctomycetaceae bacterium]